MITRYLKPSTFAGKAILLTAHVSPVQNEKHEAYGKCSLWIDEDFTRDYILKKGVHYYDYLTAEEWHKMLTVCGYFKAPENFDANNPEHAELIRHNVSEIWYAKFKEHLESMHIV